MKRIFMFVVVVMIGLLTAMISGSVGFSEEKQPDKSMHAELEPSLAEDEILIEVAYYEGAEPLKKRSSCLGKFKKGIDGFVKSEDHARILAVGGILEDKTAKRIAFNANLKYSTKDKKHLTHINTTVKLTNGEEIVIAGLKSATEESWKITIKAKW